jgi:hypothetical protein
MHVSMPMEALMTILFFLLSVLFICVCTCNMDSIKRLLIYLKMSIFPSRSRRPTPSPSTIYAFVPKASYKRNWTPNFETESCTRHSVPIWLQATKMPTQFYSSIYSLKHQLSEDSENTDDDDFHCYVTSV